MQSLNFVVFYKKEYTILSKSLMLAGFVCVRGFDQKSRSPRPLMARLHFPASKLVKNKNEDK